jgi:hypothetical protein
VKSQPSLTTYAVIEGRPSDLFHYLGPHVEDDGSVVRILFPDTEGVAIVDEHGHEYHRARAWRRSPRASAPQPTPPVAAAAGAPVAQPTQKAGKDAKALPPRKRTKTDTSVAAAPPRSSWHGTGMTTSAGMMTRGSRSWHWAAHPGSQLSRRVRITGLPSDVAAVQA